MKKILAILLVVCFAATAAFCAFSASAAGTNLAKGKSYTHSGLYQVDGNVNYPDEGGVTLTDGKTTDVDDEEKVGLYSDPAYMGFNVNYDYEDAGYSWVRVDLGDVYDVTEAVMHVAAGETNKAAGIMPPKSAKLLVSTDGEKFTEVVEVTPDAEAKDNSIAISFKASSAVKARYVEIQSVHGANWLFISELEVYGAEGTGTPDESKVEAPSKDETSSEAPAEPVKEEITVDGKLDDTGWTVANFKDITPKNGSVQSGSDLGNFKFSYAVRSDDKNVYVAIKTNAGVKSVDTSKGAFDDVRVTGTGLRLYIEVDEATKKFDRLIDVLVEDGKAVGYLAKEKTDAYTVAMVTSDKETVFEFALSIEKLGIKDSFKMAVSYCDVFGEKFDVLNDHTYNTSDNSDAPWSVDTNYTTYKVADLKLDEYVPETSKPAETTSSEAPAATSSKAPATSTGKPAAGDEGVIVFALLAVVAVAGAVVAVRKRG